jgi:uncharacterized membrane protein YkvA (DUF1232 family)
MRIDIERLKEKISIFVRDMITDEYYVDWKKTTIYFIIAVTLFLAYIILR